MDIYTIKDAKEAASEIESRARKLPRYLSDVERLIKAAQGIVEDSESIKIDEREGNWAPDDTWNELFDALRRVE